MTNLMRLSDDEKQRQRDTARRELAQIEVTRTRIRELRQQIEAVEADSDTAADRHAAATAVIQGKLEDIRQQQVEALANREEPDAELDSLRRELQDELTTHNQQLEETTTRNAALVKPLQREVYELERKTGTSTALKNTLARLAPDDQLDHAWLIEQRSRWANNALRESQSHLKKWTGLLQHAKRNNERENQTLYERRVTRWKLATDEAQQQVAQLQQEADEHRQRLLNT